MKNKDGQDVYFHPVGHMVFDTGEPGFAQELVNAGYSTRCVDDGLFELDLPRKVYDPSVDNPDVPTEDIDEFKALLDDYYVQVIRTSEGEILNEKRYLLPPTPLSQFILGMGDSDGFMKCNLSPYQSPMV